MFLYKIFNQNITYHEERLEIFWISINRDIIKYIVAYSHDEMYATIKTSFLKILNLMLIKKSKYSFSGAGPRWQSRNTLSSLPLMGAPKSQLYAEQPLMEKDQNLPENIFYC